MEDYDVDNARDISLGDDLSGGELIPININLPELEGGCSVLWSESISAGFPGGNGRIRDN